MARDPINLVRTYLAENNPPLGVWLAPGAQRVLSPSVLGGLPRGAEISEVPCEPLPTGPAIMVATAEDLVGPLRDSLLAIHRAALPGRPVICGGTANKDLLLDAINNWHVFHLLTEHPTTDELADAVVRAHRACALEHAATLCAEQLRQRCRELEQVLDELETTREQLLRAERKSTVSGFGRALAARLEDHLHRLRVLEQALCAQPDDPRRTELLGFTMQSIHEIEALLASLLANAELREELHNH
jgi:HPt (histidine-containing phosphotransfer) domain-containing protein